MSGEGLRWRFLVVEDKVDVADQIEEAASSFVDPPESVEVEICSTFKDATPILLSERFDLLILDLKDDTAKRGEEPPGLAIFQTLKKTRFLPVVFYTALAHHVLPEENAFVRIVEKTAGIGQVREEVRRVFATRLPHLSRRIEEVQRSYLWDFVSTQWKVCGNEHVDWAYLLARRLGAVLAGPVIREFAKSLDGKAGAPDTEHRSHPMDMYVYPPLPGLRLAGDIIQEESNGVKRYWILMTPSCDLVQNNADYVMLVGCEHLSIHDQYRKWRGTESPPNFSGSSKDLERLISDRQGERFKFLPGTFFIPDLVVDFQQVRCVKFDELAKANVVASLSSPYAEAMVSKLSRYLGRVGTPDIDLNIVLSRLRTKEIPKPTSTKAVLAPIVKSSAVVPATASEASPTPQGK
ncbi:MAG TPA: hypothetical protein VGP72_00545 [Planctomycetota bacterium]|jgi:CheY-like chemotaxis protein